MIDIKNLKLLTQTLKVLYIEDDPSIQASMGSYLKKLFLDVEIANNGEEGLEKYKKQEFDIVITDLSMPKMNGLEMLSKIRSTNENQAVLITSAHSESTYMIDAIKLGIDGYIIKPFDYEQLNYELSKIAEKLKKYAENREYKKHLQDMIDEKTSEIIQMMNYQSQNYEKTLISMVEMIEERDTYTAGHSKRVARYSKKIAEQMGYSEDDCIKLYQAGILHDIGKVATPDAVLLNPKNLDEIEYKLIKEHVEVGFKLLSHIPMFESLAEIVHAHHERHDGKGYPMGIGADNIPSLARVMIVADAFDAMTTSRIYKARKSVKEALEELTKLKSKQFHPDVVENAVIALKNIEIDNTISQIPKTQLEEERFVYFYKDRLCNVYNQNYLEMILVKNQERKEFKYMDTFFLNNFSKFNKNKGWSEGDKFLQAFSSSINNYFKDSIVFRIYGDDFVVMGNNKVDLSELKTKLDEIVKDTCIEYAIKSFDLEVEKINSIAQLENIK
jgi:putative nucleotidyltransferase with HDIG domain